MKVFISQPMNGKDEQTILEERAEMVSHIKEQYPDAEILESYFEDYRPSTGNVALKYLSKSLELLADADEAWFAPGWQNARGCRIENDCAIAYGITVNEIYYSMDEDTNVDMPKQVAADAIAYTHQLEHQICEFSKKVAQLEAVQQKWISVEDRLPVVGEKVIVCGVKNGIQVGKFHMKLRSENNRRWWWKNNTILEVNYWMPIPSTEGLE